MCYVLPSFQLLSNVVVLLTSSTAIKADVDERNVALLPTSRLPLPFLSTCLIYLFLFSPPQLHCADDVLPFLFLERGRLRYYTNTIYSFARRMQRVQSVIANGVEDERFLNYDRRKIPFPLMRVTRTCCVMFPHFSWPPINTVRNSKPVGTRNRARPNRYRRPAFPEPDGPLPGPMYTVAVHAMTTAV